MKGGAKKPELAKYFPQSYFRSSTGSSQGSINRGCQGFSVRLLCVNSAGDVVPGHCRDGWWRLSSQKNLSLRIGWWRSSIWISLWWHALEDTHSHVHIEVRSDSLG